MDYFTVLPKASSFYFLLQRQAGTPGRSAVSHEPLCILALKRLHYHQALNHKMLELEGTSEISYSNILILQMRKLGPKEVE